VAPVPILAPTVNSTGTVNASSTRTAADIWQFHSSQISRSIEGTIWISFETNWAVHASQKVKTVSETFQQLTFQWDACISHSQSLRSQEGRLSSIFTGKLLLTLIWHRLVKRFAVPVGPYCSKEKGHVL